MIFKQIEPWMQEKFAVAKMRQKYRAYIQVGL